MNKALSSNRGHAAVVLRSSSSASHPRMVHRASPSARGPSHTSHVVHAISVSGSSQLAQLAKMTVLSIDTGDLSIIKEWATSGVITDATTNPLFISQAAVRGDEPQYAALVDEAVRAAKSGHAGKYFPVPSHAGGPPSSDAISLAIDHLSINLGKEILTLVSGYVSTEVDIRLSFEVEQSELRARRIIELYEAAGVSRNRVLIKLAGTWEGIQAAKALEADGIRTNITLVFGFCQAVAAAQAKATLISPFPGRVLEWTKADNPKGPQSFSPADDPGVVAVRRMYSYFRKYGYATICMPASWRSSTGSDMLDEIRGLAGTDRMTMPPALLELLSKDERPLPRVLVPEAAAVCTDGDEPLSAAAFRYLLTSDGAANDKLAAGIRSFGGDTARLVAVLEAHADWK